MEDWPVSNPALPTFDHPTTRPSQSGTAPPETPGRNINRYDWSVETTRECLTCGHDFHIDSSPDLELCWECAERADAEAGPGEWPRGNGR
jgi:hypothetical protein